MFPPPPLGFWASLLRPIPSNTAVTPTIAVIKLVTPLCLALSAFARTPEAARLLIYLAAAPVAIALIQIIGLSIFATKYLKSEPHVEEMERISRGIIEQNNADGTRTIIARTSGRLQDNPQIGSAPQPTLPGPGGDVA